MENPLMGKALSPVSNYAASIQGEPTTRSELWAWWIYNFAFEPISIVNIGN